MRASFITFTVILTGAFVRWTIKGFKGKFDDVMSRPYESSRKYDMNFFVGSLTILSILFLLSKLY